MIDIKIFDVEHGFCAAINRGDHHTIMIDCGSGNQFTPAQYLWQNHCHALDCLVLPAYTKDHLAGFTELQNQSLLHGIPINFMMSNPTLKPEHFSDLQVLSSPLSSNFRPFNNTIPTMEIDELKLSFFWNNYPEFQLVHNLSLVTFIEYRDIQMILPSDLEIDGWRNLLQSADFRKRLEGVNVFVASNHGLESGYCQEVFHYCHPEVIIVSTKEHQPISSQMMRHYQSHAKGAMSGISEKKVLTTYEDGTVTISKYLDRLRQITAQKQPQSFLHYN